MRKQELMIAGLVVVALVVGVVVAGYAYRLIRMPEASASGVTRELTPEEQSLRLDLMRDVTAIASLGPRNPLSLRALDGAAEIIRGSFASAGLEPQFQNFTVGNIEYRNVYAVVKGSAQPEEAIVIGAHYDSVFDSPGADDNASGVAGLLAVARSAAELNPRRTLHLVAFANEEPPFFRTHDMGSYRYAQMLSGKGVKVEAMISIESIGFFSHERGSQRYPAPLDRFFPPTANFIAVVGNTASRPLARLCAGLFSRAGVAVEAAALPSAIQEAAWSDHWSFWKFGVPAVMITDTALFRNAHYHTETDLPDTLSFDEMTRVVGALRDIVKHLAG